MTGLPQMTGKDSRSNSVNEKFAARGFANVGAWIIGRNMFGPIRGPWPKRKWKGWWGNEPPYHCPVFVLTHHARASLSMAGGTTFHFVTEASSLRSIALKKPREKETFASAAESPPSGNL